jgi:hypothetical protein
MAEHSLGHANEPLQALDELMAKYRGVFQSLAQSQLTNSYSHICCHRGRDLGSSIWP